MSELLKEAKRFIEILAQEYTVYLPEPDIVECIHCGAPMGFSEVFVEGEEDHYSYCPRQLALEWLKRNRK